MFLLAGRRPVIRYQPPACGRSSDVEYDDARLSITTRPGSLCGRAELIESNQMLFRKPAGSLMHHSDQPESGIFLPGAGGAGETPG